MNWKCDKCGQKLTGKENFCPNCATKAVYRCMKCGKELDNSKLKYCPVCNTKRDERYNKIIRTAAGSLGTVTSLALFVVSKGKFGGKT